GRHVLALAEFFLGGADGFDLQHGNHHAARIGQRTEGSADLVGAFALVVDVFLHVFMHPAVFGAVLDGDAVVALGDIAQVVDVGLGAGPPDAVHLVARIAHALGLADGGRGHDPGAPEDDVVGAV